MVARQSNKRTHQHNITNPGTILASLLPSFKTSQGPKLITFTETGMLFRLTKVVFRLTRVHFNVVQFLYEPYKPRSSPRSPPCWMASLSTADHKILRNNLNHALIKKNSPGRITCCCDGRVVKALDSKSNGIFPRRFESCSQR